MRFVDRVKAALGSSRAKRDGLADLLASQPSGKLEDPLLSYQRFNLAGHDYKGQLSSGFAESGFGLSASVSVDLGTLFCPGLVRVPFALDAGLDRSKRTELVLVRFPRTVWSDRYTSVGQMRQGGGRTVWTTHRPLVLQTLRGFRWSGTIGASAGITAGLGNPLGDPTAKDGLGVSVAMGADVASSVDGWGVKLIDLAPRSFASAYPADEGAGQTDGSDQLAHYLNVELEGDVNRRIAAWLAEKAGDQTASDAVRGNVREALWGAPQWLAERWSDTAHDQPEWDLYPHGSLRTLWDVVTKQDLEVNDLISALDLLGQAIETQTPTTEHERTAQAADLATVKRLRLVLASRKVQPNAALTRKHVAAAPSVGTAVGPHGTLEVTCSSLKTRAGGGVALRAAGGVSVRAQADVFVKRVSFRFQAVHGDQHSANPLVFTQDTVLQQHTYGVAASAQLKSKQGVAARLYGAVTYRSACAYWRSGAQDAAFLQPNGTGVSFGLSVEAEELDAYATQCRSASGALTTEAAVLENLLVEQLRVDESTLRAFLCTYPLVGAITSDDQLEDTAVLVESSFGVALPQHSTMMPRTPGQTLRQPAALLDAPWAHERLQQTSASAPTSPLTELSALRIRYRIRREVDNSRPMLAFGWGFATDPAYKPQSIVANPFSGTGFRSPVNVSAMPTWVDRAGQEGIVDLHINFYPGPQPDDRDRSPDAYELAVPGVSLFAQ